MLFTLVQVSLEFVYSTRFRSAIVRRQLKRKQVKPAKYACVMILIIGHKVNYKARLKIL